MGNKETPPPSKGRDGVTAEDKVCPICKKTFKKQSWKRLYSWKRQISCSIKCAHVLVSRRNMIRDRECTLCKRTLPTGRFGFTGRGSKKCRCYDCERVLGRALYASGGRRRPYKKGKWKRPPKLKGHARALLQAAVRRGYIKPQPCQSCKNPKTEGHHPNYRLPLYVFWFCRKCHMKLHRKQTDTPLTEKQALRALHPKGGVK